MEIAALAADGAKLAGVRGRGHRGEDAPARPQHVSAARPEGGTQNSHPDLGPAAAQPAPIAAPDRRFLRQAQPGSSPHLETPTGSALAGWLVTGSRGRLADGKPA